MDQVGLSFSQIVQSVETRRGGNLSVRCLDSAWLEGAVAPIRGFEHFSMSGPVLPPQPNAGFSKVTYVFEYSPGTLRVRNSSGVDHVLEPGGLIWTQAGSGLIRDAAPARTGATVEGIQLAINLGAKHKQLPPQTFILPADAVAQVHDAAGNTVKILSGRLEGQRAPIHPAEEFDFFDVSLTGPWTYHVRKDWNVLLYVVDGDVQISNGRNSRTLQASQAIGVRGGSGAGLLQFNIERPVRILLMSGRDLKEPVFVYGPFVMNSKPELDAAYDRYRNGEMGRLSDQ